MKCTPPIYRHFDNWNIYKIIQQYIYIFLPKLPLYCPLWVPKNVKYLFFGENTKYIKDEKDLENYISKNSKELQKLKKGSKEYEKQIQDEKSKLSIQRFKGLGEMNPEELWNTTLNPETRNLLQVQYSKDLKKDQNLIQTLMGNDVASRKDFIVDNAINVSNLDI